MAQLEAALTAAEASFPAWAARTVDERGRLIERIADEVEAQAEELARLLTAEQGKLLDQAVADPGVRPMPL